MVISSRNGVAHTAAINSTVTCTFRRVPDGSKRGAAIRQSGPAFASDFCKMGGCVTDSPTAVRTRGRVKDSLRTDLIVQLSHQAGHGCPVKALAMITGCLVSEDPFARSDRLGMSLF
jgi:hypothetical protein